MVVGYVAFGRILFAKAFRTLEAQLRRGQVDAVREQDIFGKGLLRDGAGRIEKRAIVDPVLAKSIDPADGVDLYRRITDRKKIDSTQAVRKGTQGGGDRLRGLSRTEMIHSAWIHPLVGQPERFD